MHDDPTGETRVKDQPLRLVLGIGVLDEEEDVVEEDVVEDEVDEDEDGVHRADVVTVTVEPGGIPGTETRAG